MYTDLRCLHNLKRPSGWFFFPSLLVTNQETYFLRKASWFWTMVFQFAKASKAIWQVKLSSGLPVKLLIIFVVFHVFVLMFFLSPKSLSFFGLQIALSAS